MDPVSGYDLWSATYDRQTDNLLAVLDQQMFGRILARVSLEGKVIVDVGCGTGRHWEEILRRGPSRLIGFDSSVGMLARLRAKYPWAAVHEVEGTRLSALSDGSCDVLVSTLALGHLPDVDAALTEWSRVLRPDGDMIVTDLHPEAAARGACTFENEGETIAIKLHVHTLAAIAAAAARCRLQVVTLEEEAIDDSAKRYYDAKSSGSLFARMKGIPVIYGVHLKKRPGSGC
jgi:ubiquinone/menaquinone biosynthesis C-methylase UbiE